MTKLNRERDCRSLSEIAQEWAAEDNRWSTQARTETGLCLFGHVLIDKMQDAVATITPHASDATRDWYSGFSAGINAASVAIGEEK